MEPALTPPETGSASTHSHSTTPTDRFGAESAHAGTHQPSYAFGRFAHVAGECEPARDHCRVSTACAIDAHRGGAIVGTWALFVTILCWRAEVQVSLAGVGYAARCGTVRARDGAARLWEALCGSSGHWCRMATCRGSPCDPAPWLSACGGRVRASISSNAPDWLQYCFGFGVWVSGALYRLFVLDACYQLAMPAKYPFWASLVGGVGFWTLFCVLGELLLLGSTPSYVRECVSKRPPTPQFLDPSGLRLPQRCAARLPRARRLPAAEPFSARIPCHGPVCWCMARVRLWHARCESVSKLTLQAYSLL